MLWHGWTPQHSHKWVYFKNSRSCENQSSCLKKRKHGRSSHTWHGFFLLVKTGGPFFVSHTVYQKINPFVTMLEQDHKVIDPTLLSNSPLLVPNSKPSRRYVLLHRTLPPNTIRLRLHFYVILVYMIYFYNISISFPSWTTLNFHKTHPSLPHPLNFNPINCK